MSITPPKHDYVWGDLLSRMNGPEGISAGQLLLVSTAKSQHEECSYFTSLLQALKPSEDNPAPNLMCVYARTDSSGLVKPSLPLSVPSYQPVISPHTNVNTFIESIDTLREQGFSIGLIAIDSPEKFTLDDNSVAEYDINRTVLRILRNYALKIRASLIVTGTLNIPKDVQENRNVWDITDEVKRGLYRRQPRITQEVDIELSVLKDTTNNELHVDVVKWKNKPPTARGETTSIIHVDDASFQPPKQ